MQNILVLCIGNICRSPMAEALLRQALPGKTVHSAGIGALVGHPADPFSVQLMAEQGIDISAHRARQLSLQMVQQADLILVMEQDHKRHVEAQYAQSKGKVFRLGEFGKYDIDDPYRQGIAQFRGAFRLIDAGVQSFVAQIAQIA